jgi:hypothetical protein
LAAAAFLAHLSAFGQDQHDYSETEIPCGIRCALGAIALASENGAVPQIDPASLLKLPSEGRSLLGIKRFLNDHRMSGTAYADVVLDALDPSPEGPVILQMAPGWVERSVQPRPDIQFDRGELPHFVLAVDRNGNELLVWDVSEGHQNVPLAELEPFFMGQAMTVHRERQWISGLVQDISPRTYLLGGSIAVLGVAVFLRHRGSRGGIFTNDRGPAPP